jgi:hypothetical protein
VAEITRFVQEFPSLSGLYQTEPVPNNPDGAFGDQDFTVGVTRMVDIAGFVLQGLAVNIIAVIEIKNVSVPLRESP